MRGGRLLIAIKPPNAALDDWLGTKRGHARLTHFFKPPVLKCVQREKHAAWELDGQTPQRPTAGAEAGAAQRRAAVRTSEQSTRAPRNQLTACEGRVRGAEARHAQCCTEGRGICLDLPGFCLAV